MKEALYTAPEPAQQPPIVLAALRPKMLQLAAAETYGTHTYFMPPEQTALARVAIGPEKWLCVEHAVLLETDATKAREIARTYMHRYLQAPHYTVVLRQVGFTETDFDTISDRLVDAIVCWGLRRSCVNALPHITKQERHTCVSYLSANKGPRSRTSACWKCWHHTKAEKEQVPDALHGD